MKNLHILSFVALLLPACGGEIEDVLSVGSSEPVAYSSTDIALILDLANYPGTELETLDVEAGLDSRAAENIVSHRNGADGLALTGDDQPFRDLAELEALPYVGRSALDKMRSYGKLNPAPAAEAVDGVYFRGWEAEAAVWGVNHATYEELDGIMNSDAAANLIALRPFKMVTEMGAVSEVGANALYALRNSSPSWWEIKAASFEGVYDGVEFEHFVAQTAWDIANKATYEDLVNNGVWPTGAQRIVAGRPYITLAEVSNAYGIGTATMQGLHDYASSGTW